MEDSRVINKTIALVLQQKHADYEENQERMREGS